jgi:Flp pilus assembly protein CpaB
MAEQVPTIQNKKLLAVACVLALVVVAVYNFRIQQVKEAGKGKAIELVRLTHDLDAGDKIAAQDMELVPVEKSAAAALGNVIDKDNMNFAIGMPVNQRVVKGQWLQWGQITQQEAAQPSRKISPGMVAVTLSVDPRLSPGDVLRVGDRVNVLGVMALGSQPAKAYRIIDDVRVLAVGGRGARENLSRTSVETPQQSYRSVLIEVSPEVSLQLSNVLSHVRGSVWVEVLNPDTGTSPLAGQINPELRRIEAAVQAGEAAPQQ